MTKSKAVQQVRPDGSPDRPYFFDTTAELKQRVDGRWDSPEMLHSIYAELLYRTRKKAQQLRDQIAVRLNDLEHYFAWPTTEVTQGTGGIDPSVYRVGQGMLGFLGYRVGAAGISTLNRRALLDYIFENSLPTVDSIEYMEQWGKPRSATRLKKVANVLAALVRNAKHNNPKTYASAIKEWTADHAYLKKKYYVYRFKWPGTKVKG